MKKQQEMKLMFFSNCKDTRISVRETSECVNLSQLNYTCMCLFCKIVNTVDRESGCELTFRALALRRSNTVGL